MAKRRKKKPVIVKATGTEEVFKVSKLRDSLRRAGADEGVIQQVLEKVVPEIQNGMTTKEIYRNAYRVLRSCGGNKQILFNYNLRDAIMKLGPSGYPFEVLVGEIFKAQGNDVTVGQVIKGWCVEHEVDVSAMKNKTHTMVECKFHNQRGYRSDVKVALYVQARFEDIARWHERKGAERECDHEGWLATNTKLSQSAIKYAQCIGLRTIAWNYPERGSLRDLLIEYMIHPVTAFPFIKKADLRILLDNKVVTVDQMVKRETQLVKRGLAPELFARVKKELARLHSR